VCLPLAAAVFFFLPVSSGAGEGDDDGDGLAAADGDAGAAARGASGLRFIPRGGCGGGRGGGKR
jgi:hypothetical protein